MIDFNCRECKERIRHRDILNDRGIDEAIYCDLCERYAIHLRCMDEDTREIYDEEDYWLCDLCIAIWD
jgi:hypothetical protein